jgi:hypothetical protein
VDASQIGGDVSCAGDSCQATTSSVISRDVAVTAGTFASDASRIGSDLTCAGTSCQLTSSQVDRSVAVKAGTFTAGTSQIGGNLSCAGESCALTGSSVGSSAGVTAGTFAADAGSSVRHDLSCGGASCSLSTGSSVGHDVESRTGNVFTADAATIGDDLRCSDQGCTVNKTTIAGTVSVPAGVGLMSTASSLGAVSCSGATQCSLYPDFDTWEYGTVRRDVSATRDAYLQISAVNIGGDVSCWRCVGVDLYSSTVGDDFVSDGQTSGSVICDNTIGGSFSFSDNAVYLFTCGVNTIKGTMIVSRNTGYVGLFGNVIGGNLQLLFNRGESPVDVFGNQVKYAIQCTGNRAQPMGEGNTAAWIDPDCGPIGVSTGRPWPTRYPYPFPGRPRH